MFQRSVLQTVTERLNEPKKFIQVLVGPRQVGKTTIIKQLLVDISHLPAGTYIVKAGNAVGTVVKQ